MDTRPKEMVPVAIDRGAMPGLYGPRGAEARIRSAGPISREASRLPDPGTLWGRSPGGCAGLGRAALRGAEARGAAAPLGLPAGMGRGPQVLGRAHGAERRS